MSTPRSREYKSLIEDILDHHDQCREMGLPGLEEDEWQSLGEIVNRVIAKLEKSMAVGHSGTSGDNVPKTQPSELSEKRKERTMRTMRTVVTGESGETPGESFPPELSANPEINPFEE